MANEIKKKSWKAKDRASYVNVMSFKVRSPFKIFQLSLFRLCHNKTRFSQNILKVRGGGDVWKQVFICCISITIVFFSKCVMVWFDFVSDIYSMEHNRIPILISFPTKRMLLFDLGFLSILMYVQIDPAPHFSFSFPLVKRKRASAS